MIIHLEKNCLLHFVSPECKVPAVGVYSSFTNVYIHSHP